MRKPRLLDALNFSLAGAREGFGPFLGVYLQQLGWGSAAIGVTMGLAGLAGVVSNMPIGIFIDRSSAKRALLVAAVSTIAIGAMVIVFANGSWIIGVAQLAIGVADDSIAPLVAALTLGLVGRKAYGERVGRNEVFNHAGNAASAALAGVFGYTLGLGWVALSIVVMAVLTSGVVLSIKSDDIDDGEARGGGGDGESAWQTLVSRRPLLFLAGAAFLFQLANGAMLPFLAQARTAAGADPSITTASMVVIAQVTMIGAAVVATWAARRWGYGAIMTAALTAVAIRGGVCAFADTWPLIVVSQILEGIAMGAAGVAIPALVAKIMSDSGHANAGLGGVMAAYGAGATLSPLLAGGLAQVMGYSAAFWTMAACAIAGLALWTWAGFSHRKPQR